MRFGPSGASRPVTTPAKRASKLAATAAGNEPAAQEFFKRAATEYAIAAGWLLTADPPDRPPVASEVFPEGDHPQPLHYRKADRADRSEK